MAFQRAEKTKSGKPIWPVYFRDDQGKQRKLTFHDKAESDTFLDEKNSGEKVVTFGGWWDRYRREAVPSLREKVQGTYVSVAGRLILPFFNDTELTAISRGMVRKWITWAFERSTEASVEKALVVLSACLTHALDLDIITANPARGMAKHVATEAKATGKQRKRRTRNHLTPDQVRSLAKAVDPSFRAMILAMGMLGLRPGEAIGLKVGDIDLEDEQITVGRSVTNVGRTMVEGPTKTGTVVTIPMLGLGPEFGSHLIDKYELWKAWVGLEPPFPDLELDVVVMEHSDDILFTSKFTRGGGWIKTAALCNLVKDAAARASLPMVTADDLRHIANANLVELTGDLSFSSFVLRNSREVNLRHYDSITPTRWDSAIKKVKAAYEDDDEGTEV